MASHAEKKTDKEKTEEMRETGETKKTENMKKTKKSAGAVLCRSLGTILLAALGSCVSAADGTAAVWISYLFGCQRKYGACDPHRKSCVCS